MKYIMLETDNGRKMPIIFSDMLVHEEVFQVARELVNSSLKTTCVPLSAGFISFGFGEVKTFGRSESMGLGSREVDAAYIELGEAASHMPAAMVTLMQAQIQRRKLQGKK